MVCFAAGVELSSQAHQSGGGIQMTLAARRNEHLAALNTGEREEIERENTREWHLARFASQVLGLGFAFLPYTSYRVRAPYHLPACCSILPQHLVFPAHSRRRTSIASAKARAIAICLASGRPWNRHGPAMQVKGLLVRSVCRTPSSGPARVHRGQYKCHLPAAADLRGVSD